MSQVIGLKDEIKRCIDPVDCAEVDQGKLRRARSDHEEHALCVPTLSECSK